MDNPPDTALASPLAPALLARMDRWWRAANYLSVGQIYLLDNPLVREALQAEHVKPRLLGHWGTTPGLNFIYVHLNRIICERHADVLFVAGPGHGAPGLVANAWLEGTYSEIYPEISRDAAGMCRLFRQFSFPGGIPSHAAPQTPGSIHEGGELGYSLSHAYGAALDNPGLVVACVVGDGEAETGPLATSWHANKFLNPAADGAVLPILHLNGYKIANPTVLARIPPGELTALMQGYGYDPIWVEGAESVAMHQAMAAAMDRAFAAIASIQNAARIGGAAERPRWPTIVLRSPKGWTGPKTVDGKEVEGTWRAHQVPFAVAGKSGHLELLEDWLRSYRADALFDADGRPMDDIASLAPSGARRMSANPHSNGGTLMRPLRLPDYTAYAAAVPKPGRVEAEATHVMGAFLRDVMRANAESRNFRVFSPDENNSNRLDCVLEATARAWDAELLPGDDHLAADGRVMEILSEHTCQGWLEGYLLTGRHGLFSCYEAFIHVVDSMVNQHAKWLKSSRESAWRRPVASLNYLLTSHVWRQDHNGFSHQDPGFMDLVANKKADIARIYLPPDANSLLWITDHCLRSFDRINVIVAGKQPELQFLGMDAAIQHCSQGIGIWDWASNDRGGSTDVVMASAGDVPTLEALAATDLLRRAFPDLRIRFVNVVDLMTLQPQSVHPHGLSGPDFDALFPPGVPVIFAFHGYPALIHRLIYKRDGQADFHVHGFIEEGSTTTPFDMMVRNHLDRFHLMANAIDRVAKLAPQAAHARQAIRDKLAKHDAYVRRYGRDMPEITEWRWPEAPEPERAL